MGSIRNKIKLDNITEDEIVDKGNNTLNESIDIQMRWVSH